MRRSAARFPCSTRLKALPGRTLLAAVFLLASTLSGALTIGREIVSDYQLFSADNVGAAAWIEAHTPRDAVVLTGHTVNLPDIEHVCGDCLDDIWECSNCNNT